jgi:hypothetical protein
LSRSDSSGQTATSLWLILTPTLIGCVIISMNAAASAGMVAKFVALGERWAKQRQA